MGTRHALPGPQNPALFHSKSARKCTISWNGSWETCSPSIYHENSIGEFIFLVQRVLLLLAQPGQNFLYTWLSCYSNNTFTWQETGNIKYLQGKAIRKRLPTKPELSTKPKERHSRRCFVLFLRRSEVAIRRFQSNILNHAWKRILVSPISYRRKEILLAPLPKLHGWVGYSVFLSSKRAVRVKYLASI